MSDIVERLRRIGCNANGPAVVVAAHEAADEIARLRLTDAERKAVEVAVDAYADNDGDAECEQIAARLRGLLERTA